MSKAKQAAPEFKLLNPEMVQAVKDTADGVIQQAESASEVGAMLHDAGYTAAMLDKKSGQTNDALVTEVTTAIMYAPRFSARDRELIANADAGKTIKSNADKAAIHLAKGYIRKTLAAIRRGIETAKLREERGPAERKGLHQVLADILDSGMAKIRRDDGKNGADVIALMAAWKDCAARTNAVFKGKTGGYTVEDKAALLAGRR